MQTESPNPASDRTVLSSTTDALNQPPRQWRNTYSDLAQLFNLVSLLSPSLLPLLFSSHLLFSSSLLFFSSLLLSTLSLLRLNRKPDTFASIYRLRFLPLFLFTQSTLHGPQPRLQTSLIPHPHTPQSKPSLPPSPAAAAPFPRHWTRRHHPLSSHRRPCEKRVCYGCEAEEACT